jgi:ribosome-associated protein
LEETLSTYHIACLLATTADDKKAKELLLLRTEDVTNIADYFVICSVDSRSQMRAITDTMLKQMRPYYPGEIKVEGDKTGGWQLIDFGDVIVHVFMQAEREYYSLERYWSHATAVPEAVWTNELKKAS